MTLTVRLLKLFGLSLLLLPIPTLLSETAAPGPYRLSSAAQMVVDRLGELTALPGEQWQYHAGDLEGGERPDLQSSDWQNITLPFTASEDVVWLRRWIEAPEQLHGYDLSGARLWFKLEVSAKGPGREYAYQTVYGDGVITAEGRHLETQLLFAEMHPRQKILLAVRLSQTEHKKFLKAADLRIGFAAGRPNPDDLRVELLSGAELLPFITPGGPALEAQEEILESAARSVNLEALDRNDQRAFDASLQAAGAILEPLRPALRAYLVHMTGNAHIDAAWLWTWTETVDQVHFTFSNALQMMREYPNYTFAQSTAQYSEWMVEKFPSLAGEIGQRVKQGRWELVGGMWVEPDLNMTDGESEVRQLLIGTRYFHDHFGAAVHVGWNPDSFGFNWQLPQIYKKSGIDYFLLQKMVENESNPLPLKLFWWQAPDGSRVLTYIPHEYVIGIDPVDIASDLSRNIQSNPGQKEMLHLFGPSYGRLSAVTAREVLDSGVKWMQPNRVYPKMEFGSAEDFFKAMAADAAPGSPVWNYRTVSAGNVALAAPPQGKIRVPTWDDELYLEHHRGTYTTQSKQKRNMRESEEWLLNAEKFSSLAWLDRQPYSAIELTEAWKKTLFNQFHDVAAGSGIEAIYKDAQKDYDQVRWATAEVSARALRTLDMRIDTRGPGQPVVVWNPLAWDRGGVAATDVQLPQASPDGISVIDGNRRPVPFQILSSDPQTNSFHLLLVAKNIPSLGYSVLHVVPGKRPFPTDLRSNGWTMENSALRVSVDPHTGCITSLYDKRSRFESIAAGGCANQLQAFHDLPSRDDAWNIDMGTVDRPIPLPNPDSVQWVEKGPLRNSIRVSRSWQHSHFVQEIVLYANSDQVDVVNDIDWHETHILLKAAFPLAASSSMATYEIPYGSIQRPTTRDNSWELAKFEVPALRWADLGDGKHGFSLINESKYGYDCKGNLLRLSLLRSPIWPDPHTDQGHHHFRYALYPHAADWKTALTVRHGHEYNYPLQAMQVEPHGGVLPATHSFLRLQPSNLVLTALKKAEDGDALILRFYEYAGSKTSAVVDLPPGATAATLTNLMEKAEGAPLKIQSNRVAVPAMPYGIVSLRVDYPRSAQHLP